MLLQLPLHELIHAGYHLGFNTASGKCCCNVEVSGQLSMNSNCFNTASGKCCCNFNERRHLSCLNNVSIPQAVSAVATAYLAPIRLYILATFQYRKR